MSEAITRAEIQKIENDSRAAGITVDKGIAKCPNPKCGARNGFMVLGGIALLTCKECGTKMRRKGPPNDKDRSETGWEVAPSADGRSG